MRIRTRRAAATVLIAVLVSVLLAFAVGTAWAGTEDASGFISGVVWRDSNGNGIRDRNELPLANYPVYLQRVGEEVVGAMVATVFTDEEGAFIFDNLEVGAYQVFPEEGEYVLVDVEGVNATATVDLPVPVNRHTLFLPFTVR